MQMAEEAIRAQERDPYTAFANRVRELNYGNSYFFKVSSIWVMNSLSLFFIFFHFYNYDFTAAYSNWGPEKG